MNLPFVLEIVAYSMEAAITAQNAGADRIELCDNPFDGGTTPSFGVLKKVKEEIHIPVFPIIRPRGGHFVFTDKEWEIMREDILSCKKMGFEGVVIGMLTRDGQVAYGQTARLVEIAWPLEVTFHRAFDRVKDPFEALETIIKTGCTRILTSGQATGAPQAAALIAGLVKEASQRIIIMPGAGIRADNIEKLIQETQATEYHSSASVQKPEPYFSPVSMNEHLFQVMPDAGAIQHMKSILKNREEKS